MKVFGIEHIGLTVPDLDQAVEFFTDVFGAEVVMKTGRIEAEPEYMARRLGASGGSRIEDIVVLRCGNGTNLELFQYAGDDGDGTLKRNSEPGGFHLAFQVDDVYQAADRLRARGVDLLEGPTLVESGVMSGLNWLYLRAPWGQSLEIVSVNGPLGYEAGGGVKLWSPVHS